MILQTLPTNCGWKLFKIEGQLDFASGPTIQTAIAHIAGKGAGNVLVDVEDVKTVDERGVNALVSGVRQLLRQNPGVHVAFVARSRYLSQALGKAEYPVAVPVYRHGVEAIRAIAPAGSHRAA